MTDVVLGALVRDGRVLFGLRRVTKRAYPGVWDLPGGVVEAGETTLEALGRELREELGVVADLCSAVHLCRAVGGPADAPATLSAWLVTRWSGTPVNAAPDEHDLRWFALEELPPPAHPAVRAALVGALGAGPGATPHPGPGGGSPTAGRRRPSTGSR